MHVVHGVATGWYSMATHNGLVLLFPSWWTVNDEDVEWTPFHLAMRKVTNKVKVPVIARRAAGAWVWTTKSVLIEGHSFQTQLPPSACSKNNHYI